MTDEKNTNWENLPDRLRYLMKTLNVKQKDFAAVCGVSENYISMLVNGRRKSISEPLCRLICQMYGISEVWLKDGLGELFDVSESKSSELLRERLSEVMSVMNSQQLQMMLNEAKKQIKD